MSITIDKKNRNELHDVGYKSGGNGKGLSDIGQLPPGMGMTQVAFGTSVNFSSLSTELPSQYAAGLSDIETVPTNFNWRFDPEKGGAIAKPGDQGLCGSCWAISAAGIIGDNFVVKGLNVDEKGNKFIPDISTTWILINYGQQRCGGGNPGVAFQQIANNPIGLATNHCVDYSWCKTNDMCNGDAKKHMEANPMLLNNLIPYKGGCYYPENKHYLFKLYQQPNSIAIGMKHKNGTLIKESEWDQYKINVKKHIMANGPVLGGFLVFENFMSGAFTKTTPNKGIYLENGVYPGAKPSSGSPKSPTDPSNIKGAHAVALIGWGKEDNVDIGNGKMESVEYWYCRNSWTEKWGDDGYFKMAMWPHNKLSQFDKIVTVNTPQGPKQSGGIVSIVATQKPELVDIDKIKLSPDSPQPPLLMEDPSYYKLSASANTLGPAPPKPPSPPPKPPSPPAKTPSKIHQKILKGHKKYLTISSFLLLILIIVVSILYFTRKKKLKKKYVVPFVITEIIFLVILLFLMYLVFN